MRPFLEALEARYLLSYFIVADGEQQYPHNVVAVMEQPPDLPNHAILTYVQEKLPGLDNPVVRHIVGGYDPRFDMPGVPFVHYDRESPSWRDSSAKDPLRVFVREEPLPGISHAEQQAAIDRVLAELNAIEAVDLHLELTDILANAQIVVQTFYQPGAEFAHAFTPPRNDFDGQLLMEFNVFYQWKPYDDFFPQKFSWQGDRTGIIEKYTGPPDGRFGFEQGFRHEVFHSLGVLEHGNGILPSVTVGYYDPEWQSRLQWLDIQNIIDLYG